MANYVPNKKQSLIGIAPIAKQRKAELRFNAAVELFTKLGNPWLGIKEICQALGEKEPAIRAMFVQYKGAFQTTRATNYRWGDKLLYCMAPHITALPRPSQPVKTRKPKVQKAPSHSEGQGFNLPPGTDHAEMIPRDLAAMIGVAVAVHLVWQLGGGTRGVEAKQGKLRNPPKDARPHARGNPSHADCWPGSAVKDC